MKIQMPEKMGEVIFKPSRYKVFFGGRGGAKSVNIARALLIKGYQSKQKILCTREIQKSINESVHAVLAQEIVKLGLSDFYEVQKTTIIGRNGTQFLFAGLRSNIANIKSIPDVNICWIEEAQTVSKSSLSVLIPTIRAEGSEIWFSFNPELEEDDIYQDYVVTPPKDAIVVQMNWRDNPWFPEVLRQEMENLKERNESEYQHVWEGRPKQAVDGAIFANELNAANEQQRLTRILPKAGVPINTFWDLGHSDNTAIWFCQQIGLEYRLLDYYQANGQKMSHYIDVLAKRGYEYGTHYLPHDATHEQLSAQSTIKQQLNNAMRDNPALGKQVVIVPRIPKKALAIDAAREIFPMCVFDKKKTADGLACLRHARFVKDLETGRVAKEPVHDIWSHGTDAFFCLAQHVRKPSLVKPTPAPQMPRRRML